MSHTAEMVAEVKNLKAMKAACAVLGLEFREGQKTFKAYYSNETCDHAIRVPGNSRAYEVGVVKNKGRLDADVYSLRADSYDGGYGLMDKIGGENATKLMDEYTVQLSLDELPMSYSVTREQDEEGHIFLRCIAPDDEETQTI